MNTKTINTGLIALLMIIMALAPGITNMDELEDTSTIGYDHGSGGTPDGTAMLGGILTWQDDAWNSSWVCEGGLALVAPMDWQLFVDSPDNDPHNYTSWGMNLTGADSYYTSNAPEGEWVVTAGLGCTDDAGEPRAAGGQYGDVHDNPPTVNLTNDTMIGDVSFTLIEYSDDMGVDGHTFVCGDGSTIPFDDVNDGVDDCPLGADEQQFDTNGSKINWFDCNDGSQVWIDQVNDGIEDCPDGEDEGHSMGHMHEEIHIWEDVVNETASGAGWDVTIGIDAYDLAPDISYIVGIDVWADDNITASDDLTIMPEDVSMGYANMWWTVELMDGCYWVTVDLVDVHEGTTLAEDYMDLEVGEGDCGFDDGGDMIENITEEECNDMGGDFHTGEIGEDGDVYADHCHVYDDDEGPSFICGDGSEIPFSWVNDGEQDCADGADEQQYDTDGTEINWFDCHDGSQVWIHQVNDGNDDCADGEDEGHNDDHDDHSDDPFCYDMENHAVKEFDNMEDCEASGYMWIDDHDDGGDEAEWEGLFWMMDTDGSSTVDIDEMLVMFNPDDDGDMSTLFEMMMMMHDYDESSDLDLEEFINMMYSMEDDDDDDHGHDFCYDMEYHVEVDIDNQADCEAAGYAWSYGEDDDDADMDMDCNDFYLEMSIEVYDMGGVHFYFDQYCEFSEEDSDAYRMQLDSMFGNGDGVLNDAEVALIESMMDLGDDDDDREPMMVCYDISTHEIDFTMSEDDCEEAGLMWVSEDSGPDGDDDREDHGDDFCYDMENHLEVDIDNQADCEAAGYAWSTSDHHHDDVHEEHDDRDERDDDETWTINGVEVELHNFGDEDMMPENLAGPGPIYMTQHAYSDYVDLKDGETTIVITYVNNEPDHDDHDDHDHGDDGDDHADDEERCFEVRMMSKDDWVATAASIDSTDWDQVDDSEHGTFVYKGCEDPGEFSATYEYQGTGHPNGVENMPPVCDFWWFQANETDFTEGNALEVTPNGDVEVKLDAGKYWISVWCIDAEGDEITVKWEAPLFNLTNEFHGIGEAHGYVEFTIPAGITEVLEVPYKWHSEEWEGNGTFLISIDSGEGDGDDIEGSGDGLPGFTSLMTVTALLGAVLFLGRRD